MSRIAVFAAAVICALPLACSGLAPQALALPPGCVAVEDNDTYTLRVNDQAEVVPPCIGIHKGKTRLTWAGTDDVHALLIAFKANPKPRPGHTTCDGPNCTLEKTKHPEKGGNFNYTVVVIRNDGTAKLVDPILIIQPILP